MLGLRRLAVAASVHRPVRRLSTMSPPTSPILSVQPTRGLVDEKLKVVVESLPPGSPVTLHSLHHSEDEDYWEAFGHYVSDFRGMVSVSEDLSFGGTYTGKEDMGLLWSMRPVPGSRKGLRLRKMNVCSPMLHNISVYSGHVSEGFREQTPLTSVLVERWYMAPGVKRIDIMEKGVRGTLFIPPGPGPFPGLLDMWGGGGGLIEYRSALLASHGYVSLAMDYFNSQELESADLEFKYFETAFNIIKEHPQVIPDRVGMFGLSLGSLVTMHVAAESTIVKPRCCICVSGSHFYPRDRTIKEVIMEPRSNSHRLRIDENNHHVWRDMWIHLLDDPSKKVDVGKINCPILLVNGKDDQNVPADECAEDIALLMNAAGNGHLLSRVLYPDTGHLIEPPYSPHFRASNFKAAGVATKTVMLLWGGQTKPHSDAQEDAWRKILSFLQHNLYSSTPPRAKL
ncbi:peroxisomal succinyl-coenzyme A thioesterase-like isoform X1 [Sparus aurata]|uniref:Acyl-CoA thioesterase 18 n=2 Tax=Sparus aurata TaxID=8175 RepID=A0A671X5M2_SPAAU|nr:peroxisomal succinyl-coenzyme A thioesterase-like isoform X1 [Sparus aurata]XP_030295412.1 peroxisomal succinyl-coenzyme A thioesterase-like isoform X1 [Sparus aurata]